jgi:DNA-cytosine methyltransferase
MFKKKKLTAADLFCGTGGTSTGLVKAAKALGIEIELTAINHWETAVKTHSLNHPNARHLCTGIDEVNPYSLYNPGELDILWASPSCTHFSTARAGVKMSDQSRASAWCILCWAQCLMPRYILIENVPEFMAWGPLNTKHLPIKSRRGETFQAWKTSLESLGYTIDHKILTCANYGDPTARKRLFIQATRGRTIPMWPNATHSDQNDQTNLFPTPWEWQLAQDIIDTTIESKSIFSRKRHLAIKTVQRSWIGLIKHGLNTKGFLIPKAKTCPISPYILPQQAGGRATHTMDEPLATITTTGATALIQGSTQLSTAKKPTKVGYIRIESPDGIISYTMPISHAYNKKHSAKAARILNYCGFHKMHPIITIENVCAILDIYLRMLRQEELALAQGFPADYKFAGNRSDAIRQIGNAVPSNTAEAIALAVLTQQNEISYWLKAA